MPPAAEPAGPAVGDRLNANLKKLQLARAELEHQCAARTRLTARMNEGTIERLRRRLLTLDDPSDEASQRNARLLVRHPHEFILPALGGADSPSSPAGRI